MESRQKIILYTILDEIYLIFCKNVVQKRVQFLRAVSHAVGSDQMISASQSDVDDDDDTEADDESAHTQPPTAANTSDDAGTTTTTSTDTAAESCEVCFVAARDARFALVPCGHHRFCESCANAVHDHRRGCPLCRTPITMVLRLY